MEIKRIEALPVPPKRLKVCGYGRVSCGNDEMLHSLAAQVDYFNKYITNNPEWEYVGVFSDEAKTGTKETREGFQTMLTACKNGGVDMIVTKSISRFARNTLTVLESVRLLKNLGIDIYFQEQNIHSLSADGELMLTLLASFAQEESLSASENQKWKIRKDFQAGKIGSITIRGYKRNKNGRLDVVPEEAKIIRQIYSDYLAGMGKNAIAKKLRAQGFSISANGVHIILRNEKYKGEMLLQKRYTTDHITKRLVKNNGQLPKYEVKNSHEAIISTQTWDAVQNEMNRRLNGRTFTPKFNADNPLAGLVRCGICGTVFVRKHSASGTKYDKPVWICSKLNLYGKNECVSRKIPDSILNEKLNEVGGLTAVAKILVFPERLVFSMKDGTSVEKPWENISRRQSWTPEMKEAARQKAYARLAAKEDEQNG